jgi:hypothetical protein
MGSTQTLEGRLVPIVLHPRFTSIGGSGVQFYTFPVDVSAYEGALLTFWRGPTLVSSGTPLLNFHFEQSMNRQEWSGMSGSPFNIASDDEVEKTLEFTMKWFRLMNDYANGTGITTLWAQGWLVKRQT